MTAEVLRSLDLLVLFDDHHETFSTHTSPEATGMTRITYSLSRRIVVGLYASGGTGLPEGLRCLSGW